MKNAKQASFIIYFIYFIFSIINYFLILYLLFNIKALNIIIKKYQIKLKKAQHLIYLPILDFYKKFLN